MARLTLVSFAAARAGVTRAMLQGAFRDFGPKETSLTPTNLS